MTTPAEAFQAWLRLLGPSEGGLSLDGHDPGNWTGGQVGVGELRGTKFGISAACLHPDTRVLMRDLSWRRNGDLEVGDQLIGFTRVPARRGMQLEPAEVLLIDEIALPAVAIETGKRVIIASREHLWWGCRPKGTARNYEWLMSCDLQRGDEIAQYREPWGFRSEPGAQWLAGIIDGEGHLAESSLSLYQNEGVVAARIRRELDALGAHWSEEPRGENIRFTLTGCAFQLIGQLRPVRMLEKAELFWRGRCTHGRYNTVESVVDVREVGVQPVMGMVTSTGTFIAEGLLSHNSHPDEDIPNLTIERANQIRKEQYWDEIRGDELPGALALVLAEAAYMSGPERAIEQLQTQLGFTGRDIDGIFGHNTMNRLKAAIARPSCFGLPSGLHDVVCEFAAQRLMFESTLGNWGRYKLGWTRRLMHDVAASMFV